MVQQRVYIHKDSKDFIDTKIKYTKQLYKGLIQYIVNPN